MWQSIRALEEAVDRVYILAVYRSFSEHRRVLSLVHGKYVEKLSVYLINRYIHNCLIYLVYLVR